MKATKLLITGIMVFSITNFCAGQNLVANAGFETLVSIPKDLPDHYGYWARDYSYITTATDGITPLEGSQMVKFVFTTPGDMGPGIGGKSCELHQLINISAYSDLISSGHARASAAAWFNRVLGDAQTDTLFRMVIRAHQGYPSSYPYQNNNGINLAEYSAGVFTDGDTATWESVLLDVPIPSNTDFLSLMIYAGENIFDDGEGLEFDGHYADAVSLTIIPEPATMILFGLGCLVMRYRKKLD